MPATSRTTPVASLSKTTAQRDCGVLHVIDGSLYAIRVLSVTQNFKPAWRLHLLTAPMVSRSPFANFICKLPPGGASADRFVYPGAP